MTLRKHFRMFSFNEIFLQRWNDSAFCCSVNSYQQILQRKHHLLIGMILPFNESSYSGLAKFSEAWVQHLCCAGTSGRSMKFFANWMSVLHCDIQLSFISSYCREKKSIIDFSQRYFYYLPKVWKSVMNIFTGLGSTPTWVGLAYERVEGQWNILIKMNTNFHFRKFSYWHGFQTLKSIQVILVQVALGSQWNIFLNMEWPFRSRMFYSKKPNFFKKMKWSYHSRLSFSAWPCFIYFITDRKSKIFL